jgi:serine/threonine protein kinase
MSGITKVNKLLSKYFENITVNRLLGEGGSGKVYSIDGDSSKVVKMIPFKNIKTYEILRREIIIQKELNNLGLGPSLLGDNLDTLDDERKGIGNIFIIMETIRPISSISEIRNNPDYQKQLINEIAKMVYHGYLHNDLHVDNIALNLQTKQATVIDFGLTVKLSYSPDNKLLFDQLLLAQLYALIEPCNKNNCPGDKEDWPSCGFNGDTLEEICDGPIANEIYTIRNNESRIWDTLNKSSSKSSSKSGSKSELQNMDRHSLQKLAKTYGVKGNLKSVEIIEQLLKKM